MTEMRLTPEQYNVLEAALTCTHIAYDSPAQAIACALVEADLLERVITGRATDLGHVGDVYYITGAGRAVLASFEAMTDSTNATLPDGRPASYKVGDEVLYYTETVGEGGQKLHVTALVTSDSGVVGYAVMDRNGVELLGSFTADQLKPYAGSDRQWQLEGRTLLTAAQAQVAALEVERDDMTATIDQLIVLLTGQPARIRRDLDADSDIIDHAGKTVTLTDFRPADDAPFQWVCRTANNEIFFAETGELEQARSPRRRFPSIQHLADGLNIPDNLDLAAFLMNMRDRLIALESAQSDREAGK